LDIERCEHLNPHFARKSLARRCSFNERLGVAWLRRKHRLTEADDLLVLLGEDARNLFPQELDKRLDLGVEGRRIMTNALKVW
jgi:IS4 transposase